jgi:hypothetical protein
MTDEVLAEPVTLAATDEVLAEPVTLAATDEVLAEPRTVAASGLPLYVVPKSDMNQDPGGVHEDRDHARAWRLPEGSPFFSGATPSDARGSLRRLLTDDIALTRAMATVARRNRMDRASMCFGIAVFQPNGDVAFGAYQPDEPVNIASIAKLSIMYAAEQLKADIGQLGMTAGLADEGEPAERRRSFERGILFAFSKSPDLALRRIASDVSIVPRLARIFNLNRFLTLQSATRGDKLEFRSDSGEGPGFDSRLTATIVESDDEAATSCIANLGLPYIGALLDRAGLSTISEEGSPIGLWLNSPYGRWPASAVQEVPTPLIPDQPITSLIPARQVKTKLGPGTGVGHTTGQAGTVRALATFMIMLDRGILVSKTASRSMLDLMSDRIQPRLQDGLTGHVRSAKSQVGILPPYYSNVVLFHTNRPTPEKPLGRKAGPPANRLNDAKWVAVALLALGPGRYKVWDPSTNEWVDGPGLKAAKRKTSALANELEAEVWTYLDALVTDSDGGG